MKDGHMSDPITKSAVQMMRPLSDEFTRSFMLFSELVDCCNDDRDIRVYNIAVIVNCAAYIESEVNQKLQRLQTRKAFLEAKFEDINDVCDISLIKKTKKIQQKWNLIKNMENSSEKWNEENAVFSNFTKLYTLRNEVLHYKCDYLSSGEVPNEHIKAIMYEICDEQPYGSKPYRKQLNESWCSYLLMQKSLTKWCITTVSNLKALL